jgi:hypothetical protein
MSTAPEPTQPVPPSMVLRPEEIERFDRGNGVVTIPFVGKWNCEGNRVTTGMTVFSPGTGIPLHSHNVEESVLVHEARPPRSSATTSSTWWRGRPPGCRPASRTASATAARAQ